MLEIVADFFMEWKDSIEPTATKTKGVAHLEKVNRKNIYHEMNS